MLTITMNARSASWVSALCLALLSASPAPAATFTGDAAVWAQSATSALHMPLPPGPVAVNFGACPEQADRTTACLVNSETVYLDSADTFDLAHELGHVAEARTLTSAGRAVLSPLLGPRGVAWSQCGDPSRIGTPGFFYGRCPFERFADAWAACALRLRPDRVVSRGRRARMVEGNWRTSYGWLPSWSENKRVCDLITYHTSPRKGLRQAVLPLYSAYRHT